MVYGDPGRVRGSIIQLHVDWLREYGARNEIIAFFEAIRPPLRHLVLAAQPAHWYRFSAVVDLQKAIATHFGGGDPQFITCIGAFAAQRQLAPLRPQLQRSAIHDFLRAAASAHRESLDFGESEHERVADLVARLTVKGLGSADSHRGFVSGYYREAIAQHGGLDVTVRHAGTSVLEFCWQ